MKKIPIFNIDPSSIRLVGTVIQLIVSFVILVGTVLFLVLPIPLDFSWAETLRIIIAFVAAVAGLSLFVSIVRIILYIVEERKKESARFVSLKNIIKKLEKSSHCEIIFTYQRQNYAIGSESEKDESKKVVKYYYFFSHRFSTIEELLAYHFIPSCCLQDLEEIEIVHNADESTKF